MTAPGAGSVRFRLLRALLDGRDVALAAVRLPAGRALRNGEGALCASLPEALGRARSSGCSLALVLAEARGVEPGLEGFRELPASEAACRVRLPVPWPKEPAWVEAGDPMRSLAHLREADPGDRECLAEIRLASTAGQRLRVVRDRESWDGILRASGERRGHTEEARRHVWVCVRGARVVAYAILEEAEAALFWREHGASPGAEPLLNDLFWAALSRARRADLERLEGWYLPPAASALYPVARRARLGSPILIGVIDPSLAVPVFTDEDECRVWPLDLP